MRKVAGTDKVVISKQEWLEIGKKAGWTATAGEQPVTLKAEALVYKQSGVVSISISAVGYEGNLSPQESQTIIAELNQNPNYNPAKSPFQKDSFQGVGQQMQQTMQQAAPGAARDVNQAY